jgi:hypothetical protein
MGRRRRLISKAKTYGFHPWFDQVDAIDQILKDTGLSESIILRKLIDEALVARRRQTADDEVLKADSDKGKGPRNPTEELLLRMLKQQAASLQIQDITLALIQETLVEARAGRSAAWKRLARLLEEQGLSQKEIEKRFSDDTEAAKDFAYGVAQELATTNGH